MTMGVPLPPEGDTSWFDWAAAVHAKAEAVDGKASLANPTFTGNVVVPTADAANEAVTKGQMDAADTLKADAAATAASFALRAPLADPTFTGTPAAPTPATAANSTQVATTAYVKANRTEQAAADAAQYQPIDSDLVALAALTTTAYGRAFLALADAAAARTALGLGNAATLTVDADLATLALPAATTISTFGASLVDDTSASFARSTLSAQALDGDLTAISGTGKGAALAALSVFGATIIDDADAATARTTLGLGTAAVAASSAFQTADADLTAIAGLASAADRVPYFTGAGTAALATFTAVARSLVANADAAAMRTTLLAAGSAGNVAATLGANLIVNGAFTGGTTSWVLAGGATYGTDNVNVVNGSTVTQNVVVVAGEQYEFLYSTAAAHSLSLGSNTFAIGGSGASLVAAASGSVAVTFTFTAAGTFDGVSMTQIVKSAVATVVGGIDVRKFNNSLAIGLLAHEAMIAPGAENTAIGYAAHQRMVGGAGNTAIGSGAQQEMYYGLANVAIGQNAAKNQKSGTYNVIIGSGAGENVVNTSFSVAIGYRALRSVTTGGGNVAVGASALEAVTTGSGNVCVGGSLAAVTIGSSNIAVGGSVMNVLTSGAGNVGIGSETLSPLTTGNDNIHLGRQTGRAPNGNFSNGTVTASNQVCIGFQAGLGSTSQDDNIVAVGYRAIATGNGSAAFGQSSHAAFTNSVALGSGTVSLRTNSVCVGDRDIELTGSTRGVILKSATKRWRITVNDAGVLTTTEVV